MSELKTISVTVQRCCGSCKHFMINCKTCGRKLFVNNCNKLNAIVVESQLCKLYDGRDDMLDIVMEVEKDEQTPD